MEMQLGLLLTPALEIYKSKKRCTFVIREILNFRPQNVEK